MPKNKNIQRNRNLNRKRNKKNNKNNNNNFNKKKLIEQKNIENNKGNDIINNTIIPRLDEINNRVRYIMSENVIIYNVKKEKLRLWICSYGGSGSNMLVNYLKFNYLFYYIDTDVWKKILCHYEKPLDLNLPMIYIYDDPRKSFMSMRRRGSGFWDTNQKKLSNNEDEPLSDENLLKLMIQQFKNWTNHELTNKILFIDFRYFFTEEIKNKLSSFLNITIKNYPIYTETNKYNFDDHKELFEKYKDDIDYILNYYENNK